MVSRRMFVAGAGFGLAAPFLLRSPARTAELRVRRDVMELADDDPFFQKYAAAVKAMRQLPETDGRNWRRQARIHADYCRHANIQFLHWHRHYLAFFEAICGELIGDPGFALPYWKWSKRSGVIPAPFFDLDALNVERLNDPGVYTGLMWGPVDSVGKRGLVRGQGLLDDPQRGGPFTSATIDAIKRYTNADQFRGRLEGTPHNSGHVVVGATSSGKPGHMGSGLSPLDPLFWLHHCMVDRIWAEWQAARNIMPSPADSYAGNFFDRSGAPAAASAAGAMDVSALGYTYDVLAPATPQSAAPGDALLKAILPDLEKALRQPAAPTTLGTGVSTDQSVPFVETPIRVSAPGLQVALTGNRAFRDFSTASQSGLNVEGRRVIVSFTGVTPPEVARDLIVNVFVNCDYLEPTTPYTDPHYAGTFSFFGRMAHSDHGFDFLVDVTAPVQRLADEGRIKDDRLTIQLMPLPASADGKSEATFTAGKVDIVAI